MRAVSWTWWVVVGGMGLAGCGVKAAPRPVVPAAAAPSQPAPAQTACGAAEGGGTCK